MDATLGLCWPDTLETARAGLEGVPPEEQPPLSREQTEVAMEILKILFNITFDTTRRKVDEVLKEITHYRSFHNFIGHYQYYTNNCELFIQKSMSVTAEILYFKRELLILETPAPFCFLPA